MNQLGNIIVSVMLTHCGIYSRVRYMKTETQVQMGMSPMDELKTELQNRRSKNRRYSLRSFAKDLNVSAGQLSKLLNGQSSITHHQAARFAAALNLPKALSKKWVEFAIINAPENAKVAKKLRTLTVQNASSRHAVSAEINSLAVDHFKAISQWYHLPILELTYLDSFNPDPQWIAKQLGITLFESKDAISRLLDLGLLETCPKKGLKKSNSRLFIKSRSEPEVRKFQHQMINKAIDTLESASVEEMDKGLINSITFPVNSSAVPEIREAIFQFQRKILKLIKNENYTQLYQFNCQLFPLNSKKKEIS